MKPVKTLSGKGWMRRSGRVSMSWAVLIGAMLGGLVGGIGGPAERARGDPPNDPVETEQGAWDEAAEPTDLRAYVTTSEGVFVVKEAVVDPEVPCYVLGYLAFYQDRACDERYVYNRVVHTRADVGHALLNLGIDLGLDPLSLAWGDPALQDALDEAALEEPDETRWGPGDPDGIFDVLAGEFPELASSKGVAAVAAAHAAEAALMGMDTELDIDGLSPGDEDGPGDTGAPSLCNGAVGSDVAMARKCPPGCILVKYCGRWWDPLCLFPQWYCVCFPWL